MANKIDDGEFWLPSEFLTDDDILSDFHSDLSSPVPEPDSDEDEFLAELTLRMARIPKVLSCSPQSTLFPPTGSSRGSPSGPVSPPPTAAKEGYFVANDAASFDLLYAAAGEVAKLRAKTEHQQKGTGYFDSSRGFLYPPRNQPGPDFNAFFSHQQFQLQQLWRNENGITNNHLGLSSSAFRPLQRHQGRQPHAVPVPFVAAPVSKSASTGTGVFLPRRVNNAPAEPRRIRNNKAGGESRVRGHSNGIHGPRRESARSNSDIQLPSEWTY